MNCRDFLNEFEERRVLSETATLHLNDCADCRKINVAQTRVWQLIDRFEPVDAPKDFDFRVKARVANAKPADFKPHFLPALRYGLPLSIVILILAFVVFRGVYFLEEPVPQVAEKTLQPPSLKESLPLSDSTKEDSIAASQPLNPKTPADIAKTNLPEYKKAAENGGEKTRFVAVRNAKKSATKIEKNNEKTSGGSQVLAASQPHIYSPKGIQPGQTNENPSNFETASSITAEQILSQLGIEVVAKNGKREVRAVKQNSVGERSGVRIGDTIEAIDGENLGGEPIRAKKIEGKKLTVARGAEKIEILLRN